MDFDMIRESLLKLWTVRFLSKRTSTRPLSDRRAAVEAAGSLLIAASARYNMRWETATSCSAHVGWAW